MAHLAPMWRLAQKYAPQIMLPVTMVIGFIGYHVENRLRPDAEPKHKSTVVSLPKLAI